MEVVCYVENQIDHVGPVGRARGECRRVGIGVGGLYQDESDALGVL
jgi:hypothetical protein